MRILVAKGIAREEQLKILVGQGAAREAQLQANFAQLAQITAQLQRLQGRTEEMGRMSLENRKGWESQASNLAKRAATLEGRYRCCSRG